MVEEVFLLNPIAFVSLVCDIIQFTFVLSISTRLFLKIDADTVGFHITHSFAELLYHNLNDADHMVFETFPVKSSFRTELQMTALVCIRELLRYEGFQ